MLPAYISGQSVSVQGSAILNVVSTRVPIGAHGAEIRAPNFERRELAPRGLVWDQGLGELQRVPFGADEPTVQTLPGVPGTVDTQSSQEESQDSQGDTIEEGDTNEERMDSEDVVSSSDTAPSTQRFPEEEGAPSGSTSREVIRPLSKAASSLRIRVLSGGQRSVVRPYLPTWRTGPAPWEHSAIRSLLEELYQITRRKGGFCAGKWPGPSLHGSRRCHCHPRPPPRAIGGCSWL